ncbi:4-azaleucine resistance probable transporter AzlC [Fontibacillus panacisegetis]|uniref:4-azaleucine resistance probable transporter AzlC n=1 Tax=Fontibacillus panacisegetis TaxID=670482 RepID=A0A1G7NNS0_9BACL|nr:AzlC family ABC transporter permease [Fontibacillus panacisegetis]SDF75626.1 4-azaleucine resistance probable transporter AzlC [Fontibacillus panacisegetis]
MKRREEMTVALRDAIPIIIAYFPLSMTFGVLASASGLPALYSILSSVWVYSGGAQFMLVSMFAEAIVPMTIITTILLVNLRHVLYGATLGPSVKEWREPYKWLAALGLTDEIFAVVSSRVNKGEQLTPTYYLTFAISAYGSWILGTIAGSGLGGAVTPDVANILSFALPALFLALLFGGQRGMASMLAACTGAVVATIAGMLHLGGIGLVAGGLIGATIGLLVTMKLRLKQVK